MAKNDETRTENAEYFFQKNPLSRPEPALKFTPWKIVAGTFRIFSGHIAVPNDSIQRNVVMAPECIGQKNERFELMLVDITF